MVANNGHYAREQNLIVGAASGIKEDNKGWGIYRWGDEAKTILVTAIKGSNHTARQTAEALIHHLGERGYWEFRELLSSVNRK